MAVNILLAVLCLSGCLILSRCRQYYFVNQPLNWGGALNYCRQKNYTGLANIGNSEEMTQLITTVSSAGYNSQVWIGIRSYLYGQWPSQTNNAFWKWENQTANEPFLVYSYCETVLVNGPGSWSYWDYSCSVEYPFICYNATSQGTKYVFVNVSMDWFRAMRYCRENFTDLPQTYLSYSPLVPNGVRIWTGVIGHPRIFWRDGTDSSFRYWDDSKKISGMLDSLYGVADLQKSGKWRLIYYNTALPFVCYNELPAALLNKEVIQMRLKLDSSSVDLNDAAVKANLLKKLQDRLKEKGVDGVTLKWREQPDGADFHKEEKKNTQKTEL